MAPTSFDELRQLLERYDLPADLAEGAFTGLALVAGGQGRSKLGGVPEIPGEWPVNNGRALTHLASIALDELPAIPQRASLPSDGTLVFFADFSLENEGWGPAAGDDPVIKIVHVPAGAACAAPTPPDEQRDEGEIPVVLNERRVRFEPVVTVPAEALYEAISELELESPDAFFVELAMPTHQLLGEPEYLQGDPREPGELHLLQLNSDAELGFIYGDAGQVSFYGALDDLRMGNWHRIKASPASC